MSFAGYKNLNDRESILYSATFKGRLKLRCLDSKEGHRVVFTLFGSQVFAKNSVLKLKDGIYRKIVAELEIGSSGLFLNEILEAYE